MKWLRNLLGKIKQKAIKHNKKLRFLFVGGFNTTFGLMAYPALYFLLAPYKYLLVPNNYKYLEILVISQMLCITVAFLTNKLMVFRTTGNYLKEYGKFLIFHFSYLLVNLAVLPVLVEMLSIHPVYAQTMFAVLVVVSSYFWYSRVTFSTKKVKL